MTTASARRADAGGEHRSDQICLRAQPAAPAQHRPPLLPRLRRQRADGAPDLADLLGDNGTRAVRDAAHDDRFRQAGISRRSANRGDAMGKVIIAAPNPCVGRRVDS